MTRLVAKLWNEYYSVRKDDKYVWPGSANSNTGNRVVNKEVTSIHPVPTTWIGILLKYGKICLANIFAGNSQMISLQMRLRSRPSLVKCYACVWCMKTTKFRNSIRFHLTSFACSSSNIASKTNVTKAKYVEAMVQVPYLIHQIFIGTRRGQSLLPIHAGVVVSNATT